MSGKRYYLTTQRQISDMPYSVPASAIDLGDLVHYMVVELCERFMAEPDDDPMHEAIRKAWAITHIADLEAKIRSYGEEP